MTAQQIAKELKDGKPVRIGRQAFQTIMNQMAEEDTVLSCNMSTTTNMIVLSPLQRRHISAAKAREMLGCGKTKLYELVKMPEDEGGIEGFAGSTGRNLRVYVDSIERYRARNRADQ